MARRNTRARSTRQSDPSIVAMRAPQRIFELKRERDERTRDIIKQAEDELASVQDKATAYKTQCSQQSARESEGRLRRVMELAEKRRQLEAQMLDVVMDLHARMQEVEDMMLVGFEGRQKEAERALEALVHEPCEEA